METKRHTCLKLEIPDTQNPKDAGPIFVKGTWYDTHFDLAITDGLSAWVCHGTDFFSHFRVFDSLEQLSSKVLSFPFSLLVFGSITGGGGGAGCSVGPAGIGVRTTG